MKPEASRSQRGIRAWAALLLGLLFAVSACGGGTSTAPGWTFPPADGGASLPISPVPTTSAVAGASATPDASLPPGATPKPFSGRMTPHVLLVDGYLTMYMELVNTGSEPLTFLNTLYDTEPTRLYAPTVVYPWTTGETALLTRAGRFFPSPAIIGPGERAVYLMGGMPARGTGEPAEPVANIKFCPTRGMDDIPSIPVQVRDVAWSSSDGLTTVTGTLVETEGSRRASPPVVGVSFFDAAGAFVGAVVDSRTGDRLQPNSSRPFTILGRGVDADRIFRAEAFAFAS